MLLSEATEVGLTVYQSGPSKLQPICGLEIIRLIKMVSKMGHLCWQTGPGVGKVVQYFKLSTTILQPNR